MSIPKCAAHRAFLTVPKALATVSDLSSTTINDCALTVLNPSHWLPPHCGFSGHRPDSPRIHELSGIMPILTGSPAETRGTDCQESSLRFAAALALYGPLPRALSTEAEYWFWRTSRDGNARAGYTDPRPWHPNSTVFPIKAWLEPSHDGLLDHCADLSVVGESSASRLGRRPARIPRTIVRTYAAAA